MNFAEMMIIELLEVTTPMDFARMGSTPRSNTPLMDGLCWNERNTRSLRE
jgi:hypothetical protein